MDYNDTLSSIMTVLQRIIMGLHDVAADWPHFIIVVNGVVVWVMDGREGGGGEG